MVRLTQAKKEQHRGWLYQWRSPADMLQHVHATMDELGNVDLFNQAGLEFLRDSWAAATFGNIRNASAVRLVEAEWPDFELKFGFRKSNHVILPLSDKPGLCPPLPRTLPSM